MEPNILSETDSSGHLRSDEEVRLLDARQKRLESLVAQSPNDTNARIQLASILLARGSMQDGARELVDAVHTLDGDTRVILQLANLLSLCAEFAAARTCLSHPALQKSTSAAILTMLANQRYMLGEVSLALEWMQKAVSAGADGPGEILLLANLLQYSGRLDEAAETYESILRRWPRFGTAALARSRLRKQTRESNHIDDLRSRLQQLPTNTDNKDVLQVRAEFAFALFKELDDLGQHEEAWQELERGNGLLRRIHPYAPDREARFVDSLIEASNHIGQDKTYYPAAPTTPIFIVGMLRSGTSLLEHMLSNHSQIASAGELKGFKRHLMWAADVPPGGDEEMNRCLKRADRIDFDALRRRYLEQSAWSTEGKPYFIDKQPLNFQLIFFIRRAFPEAPILHMVRDPMSVCFSNYKIMFNQVTSFNNDLESLAHFHKQYTRLTEHWDRIMPDAMLRVDYADLVREPDITLQGILAHCNLHLEEDCLHPERNPTPVATPSSTQVREPLHARFVEEWGNYARHLEPLRAALGD